MKSLLNNDGSTARVSFNWTLNRLSQDLSQWALKRKLKVLQPSYNFLIPSLLSYLDSYVIEKSFLCQDWKYRHAALMAISASGEGCHKQMEPFLSQVMDGVINYIQDPHPRYDNPKIKFHQDQETLKWGLFEKTSIIYFIIVLFSLCYLD